MKSIRAWIIANITFDRNIITHKSTSNRLSKQFVVLMRRQMNKTNTAIGIHVKIAMMLLIKTIIKSQISKHWREIY
jgi:hypothetical protein